MDGAESRPEQVTLILEGERHTIAVPEGETILSAALGAGLYVESSCEVGDCGTCKLRRLSGAAEQDNDMGLTDEEVEAGYVLCCVGRPQGPGLVLSDER
ncbi:2Fe-2S iron-sulfur cluster-binding protein [Plesiocystis pacifica]|uniref:2Fe-2S iron-sulfur cluster-binding protein n=1 Tax=Plesiocystis pacifica TaxID=191768 RepID=UPI0005D47E0B|nr:2Fe-2S iron-sulfur cluster binding domain-containing protein [Plesiocystis pacifica]